MRKLLILLIFVSCNNQSDENNETILNQQTAEIYLLNTLNDSRGYCIDMKGYKTNANINSSLQAHSCYSYQGEISVDQGFDIAKITDEEFYIIREKDLMTMATMSKPVQLMYEAYIMGDEVHERQMKKHHHEHNHSNDKKSISSKKATSLQKSKTIVKKTPKTKKVSKK